MEEGKKRNRHPDSKALEGPRLRLEDYDTIPTRRGEITPFRLRQPVRNLINRRVKMKRIRCDNCHETYSFGNRHRSAHLLGHCRRYESGPLWPKQRKQAAIHRAGRVTISLEK